jgi:hypothetical protein
MKTKSDTWDRGNRLTQFYEVNEECPLCDGYGKVTGNELYDKRR